MMKDEKKYAELVDVLDQLEQWNQELFSKAGLCSSPDSSNTITPQPLVATTSRPDQPASHTGADLGVVKQVTRLRLR